MSRPHVGIDLGTTHSACAVSQDGRVRVLPVHQLVAFGRTEALPLLPSALHAPVGETEFVVGEYARQRALELPARSIVSAKSWLSNANVSREDPILPWGSDDPGAPHLSPVDASAAILRHLVQNARDELGPPEHWDVTVTVPASFDDVARALTVRAAERAGLSARLLEEPVAAFGDCLESGAAENAAAVLVVDVGGGTADFSLLERTGARAYERVATGSHLLLGGDNVDLALAHLLERRLGEELSPMRFAELIIACRAAKELLLAPAAPERARVALAARGAGLVAGSKSVELEREEVRALVLDGFLPEVDAGARPHRKSALRSFGLPYERDTAITRHLAAFVAKHPRVRPDAVFFNGGFFRGHGLTERVATQVEHWLGTTVRVLPNETPDLAVARGAAIHGEQRARGASRIQARSIKNQWLRVQNDRAICVLPKGTAEGSVIRAVHALTVLRGQPARFELQVDDADVDVDAHGSANPMHAAPQRRWDPEAPTAYVVAQLPGAGEAAVRIEAERTPLGLLELRLIEQASNVQHVLAFDLRAVRKVARTSLPPGSLHAGPELIRVAFAKDAGPRLVKDLTRDLEKKLGERAAWTGDVLRPLADALIEVRGGRRLSADHERVFWNLLGYALRPGRGAPGDEARLREVVALYEQKLAFPDKTQGWQAFFIAWRRTASGVPRDAQRTIAEELAASVLPGRKPKKKGRIYEVGRDEMAELLASLEYAPLDFRVELGAALVERSYVALTPRLMTDLSRLGARRPFYASVEQALPPAVVEGWLEALLRARWEATAPFREGALAMARLTGDRARDLRAPTRLAVRKKLLGLGVPEGACRPLVEVCDVAETATLAFYGDALPLGLRLDEA